jgi:hypothetical protein
MRKAADWKVKAREKADKRWLKDRALVLPVIMLCGLMGAAWGGAVDQSAYGIFVGGLLGMAGGAFLVTR